jgi:hypothetical protein
MSNCRSNLLCPTAQVRIFKRALLERSCREMHDSSNATYYDTLVSSSSEDGFIPRWYNGKCRPAVQHSLSNASKLACSLPFDANCTERTSKHTQELSMEASNTARWFGARRAAKQVARLTESDCEYLRTSSSYANPHLKYQARARLQTSHANFGIVIPRRLPTSRRNLGTDHSERTWAF